MNTPYSRAQASELADLLGDRLTAQITSRVRYFAIPALAHGYRERELVILDYGPETKVAIKPGKKRHPLTLWFRRRVIFRMRWELRLFGRTFKLGRVRKVYLGTIHADDYDTRRLIKGLGLLAEPVDI